MKINRSPNFDSITEEVELCIRKHLRAIRSELMQMEVVEIIWLKEDGEETDCVTGFNSDTSFREVFYDIMEELIGEIIFR